MSRLSLTRTASSLVKLFKNSNSRPAPPPPTASPSLPPEIWLHILEFLSSDTLGPITLTSHDLRALALPRFLHTQLFFPFVDTFEFRRRSATVELSGYERRSIARIRFLLDQAGALRELLVSPYPPGYNRRHPGSHKPDQRVMTELFVALPRFTNLTKLVLILAPMDDGMTRALRSLQRLEFFELEVPLNAKGTVPVPARNTFLVNRNTSLLATFASDALVFSFLYPSEIQHIVAGPSASEPVACALAQTAFPALHTLDLALIIISSSHFVAALHSVPNLASFRLRRTAIDIAFTAIVDFPSIPADVVPRLKTYHGPAAFAPSFASTHSARARPLKTLRLWSSHSVSAADSRSPWDLPPLLRQLTPGQSQSLITHLELGTVRVPPELLDTLCDASLFPVLTVLSINAHFDAFHPGSFERRTVHEATGAVVSSAEAGLPLTLQTLRLGAQLGAAGMHSDALCAAARKVLAGFPAEYDPTSWRVWAVDRPWCVIQWTRTTTDDEEEGIGLLSVEYGEHYFRGFEREARIAVERVEEAMARMIATIE